MTCIFDVYGQALLKLVKKKGGVSRMGKYDEFDLDVQVIQFDRIGDVNITSVSLCTPGSCNHSCDGDSTLNSNCCLGTTLCATQIK